MPRALFRVDSSTQIGGGHLFRCLTLAKALRREHWQCVFLTLNTPGNLNQLINDNGFHLVVAENGGAMEAQSDAFLWRNWILSQPYSVDLVVADHYQLDASWHKIIKALCSALLVIDDLANRDYRCDALLDQSTGRLVDDYQGKVPSDCRMLLGTQYALLREEFAALRPKALAKRQATEVINRLLIAISATDPNNVTLEVLQALKASGCEQQLNEIHIILTSQAPGIPAVQRYLKQQLPHAQLHIDAQHPEDIIFRCDFYIAAAGTSLLERHSLGLSGILLCIADNQRHIAEASLQMGSVSTVLKPEQLRAELGNCVKRLITSPQKARLRSLTAAQQCDARGCERVVKTLGSLRQKPHLQKVQPKDKRFLFELQQQPSIRQHARHPEAPTWQEHCRWFGQIQARDDVYFFLIMQQQVPSGFVRCQPRTVNGIKGYEVSIGIDDPFQGMGLGSQALQLLADCLPDKTLLAWIKAENQASIKAFSKSGYRAFAPNWYQYRSI